MKKILILSLIPALALTFGSCNNEPDFPGSDEAARPKNVTHYDATYIGPAFSAENPAAPTLVTWLNAKYYSCDEGSTALVKYDFKEPATASVLFEDFERTIAINEPTQLPGWVQVVTKGTTSWVDRYNAGNTFTQFSANNTTEESEAYLLMPVFKAGKGMNFTFDACLGYYNEDCIQVLISTNYTGNVTYNNIWTDITDEFDFPEAPGTTFGSWSNTGVFDLSEYAGSNVWIAFKYNGDGTAGRTTTYQIDNVQIYQNTTTTTDQYDEFEFLGQDKKWSYVRTVPKDLLNEDFEGGGNVREPVALPGWYNIAVVGEQWEKLSYNNNSYAQFRAYEKTGPQEVWLITPAVELDGSDYILSFDVTTGSYNGDALTIWISTDYDGSGTVESVADATWDEITEDFTIPTLPTSGYGVMGPAGSRELSDYDGQTINVGFRYVGHGQDGPTTTHQIDNVVIGK